jgi:hypothetical protein
MSSFSSAILGQDSSEMAQPWATASRPQKAHGSISPPDEYMIERCIRRDHCELVKWIISTYPRLYVYGNLISTTVNTENLRMLDWLAVYDGRKTGFMDDVALMATLFQKPRVTEWLEARRYARVTAN